MTQGQQDRPEDESEEQQAQAEESQQANYVPGSAADPHMGQGPRRAWVARHITGRLAAGGTKLVNASSPEWIGGNHLSFCGQLAGSTRRLAPISRQIRHGGLSREEGAEFPDQLFHLWGSHRNIDDCLDWFPTFPHCRYRVAHLDDRCGSTGKSRGSSGVHSVHRVPEVGGRLRKTEGVCPVTGIDCPCSRFIGGRHGERIACA